MSGRSQCGEFIYSQSDEGEIVSISDTKFRKVGGKILAVFPGPKYEENLRQLRKTQDPTAMFDSPEQHATLNPHEMRAILAYGALTNALDLEQLRMKGSQTTYEKLAGPDGLGIEQSIDLEDPRAVELLGPDGIAHARELREPTLQSV